tara:strand:- start:1034 stop:1405 length:372 start_codon:yes stop_codon:yes gene_type:complete
MTEGVMLNLAKSESVRGVVEETVDIILRGGADDKEDLESHKNKIVRMMEDFFQLSIEALVNFDTDKCMENTNDCDLLMLCLRLVEGVEAWKDDTPSLSIIHDVLDSSDKDEKESLRFVDLDFE